MWKGDKGESEKEKYKTNASRNFQAKGKYILATVTGKSRHCLNLFCMLVAWFCLMLSTAIGALIQEAVLLR